MKNFKLFLLSGVFCILIVSVAIATTRNCTDTRPTCEQLGYKWDCGVRDSYIDHVLKCPWDPTKKYCPAATGVVSDAGDSSNENVDCIRKNCATLGFSNVPGDCPYNYIPCPFDQLRGFCAYPSTAVSVSGGGIGSGGNSAVVGPTLP